ncbi:Ephrin type-A receptor 4 [Ceratobasidium sp. AG-Ba]|nr:Ephrin type-A receptor 4 [Ceratobasidium sp. AG-Ba]
MANQVHGDLKGQNVLISDDGAAVLIDFGNAAMGESTLQFTATATNQSITARWAAPEIVEGGKHSVEADVYALGMTILETFTGRVPYPEKNLEVAVLHTIAQRRLPDRPYDSIPNTRWGEALWKLLLMCWAEDPGQRPAALQVRDELQRIRNDGAPGSAMLAPASVDLYYSRIFYDTLPSCLFGPSIVQS